jgi:5'-3' exonuclease
MKRFTLVIDGHNFFFRSLWGIFRQNRRDVLSSQNDRDIYEKKLMVDFCNTIKQMEPVINDIVFVEDSRSWRKDLLLQQEYKGNRRRYRENVNKDGFNTVTESFTRTLSALGVKVSRVESCEGDDLIFAWTDFLFGNGRSSLIVSTDRDLTQLVKCIDGVHVIQYAPINNRLYVSKETSDFIESLDKYRDFTPENLFGETFTISVESDPFKKFVSGTNVEIVEPEIVRFKKIVSGDQSDNIYPVYYKKGDGETRSKGIGEKTADKIYAEFVRRLGCGFNYTIYSNDDAMKMLCNVIYDVMKINDEKFTRRMLLENLKTNSKLVSLTEESIPEHVVRNMLADIGEESGKTTVVSKITRDRMFSKSRFGKYDSTIRVNAIKVSDDGDMSFIKD